MMHIERERERVSVYICICVHVMWGMGIDSPTH